MKRTAAWALGLAVVMAGSAGAKAQYGPPQGPPPGNYQGGPGGWDAPPPEFRDAARRGFQDGLNGAQKDFENRRPWNVNNRDEFRHPDVPGPMRRDYKMGFKRGYDAGVRHYMQGRPGSGRPY